MNEPAAPAAEALLTLRLRDFFEDEHRRHLALTALVAVGLTAYLTGTVRTVFGFDLALILALIGGFPILSEAVIGLFSLRISADLAVSLAAIAAIAIGQYPVAAEVILIMLIGEALEDYVVDRTRDGIEALLTLRPATARVHRDGKELIVPADEVQLDDTVLVRPGDRIPVDGTILSGGSSVDQSAMTGESVPCDKLPGDEVFAGTMNLCGQAEITVTRLGKDTTLEHIIQLVEEAESAKAPTQRLADKYATFFVPIVLIAAAITYALTREVTRSVAVLVVACPCALVLATPTAIAAGIGRLVREGILIKGGAVLEALGRLKSVIFDKTGTLTSATLKIRELLLTEGQSENELLALSAAVEQHSEHPVGQLLIEHARDQGLAIPASDNFAAHPGLGAEARVAGALCRVGNRKFLEEQGVVLPEAELERIAAAATGATLVLVAREDALIGAAVVADTVRPEAAATIQQLTDLGITKLVMLTGDNAAAAAAVGAAVGIEDQRSDLLPDDKVAAVRSIQAENGPTAMVGDGINDAPSLATADIGIVMGDIGSDAAIASADVVLIGDDLAKLVRAAAFSRQVLRRIWQNIFVFALGFNALAVIVASMGWISPVVAACLHQVSSLIVVTNSLRLVVDGQALRERCGTRASGLWELRGRALRYAAITAIVLYALSGIHTVRPGEVGVVQRFGRVIARAEAPGLHARLPYPFGQHRTVKTQLVRRVEVGFRTIPGNYTEPPAYEWNVQHRRGRRQRQEDEATVWTGDENLVDLNMVVQYRVTNAADGLFLIGHTTRDGSSKWDQIVRALALEGIASVMSQHHAREILSERRGEIEAEIMARLQHSLAAYTPADRESPIFTVEAVCLGDVHPPLEVVPAFREVASALEDKEARINRAKAYQCEVSMLVQGQAAKRVLDAEAFRQHRAQRAGGDAERFTAVAAAHAEKPEATRLRWYLEMIEQTLTGRRKVILDRTPNHSRRMVYLGKNALWSPPIPAPSATDATDAIQGEPGE